MIIKHKSPTAPYRINTERAAEMRSGFLYGVKGNAVFQTDDFSIELIIGRVAKILAMKALGQTHPDFLWRDKNDTDHTFTQDEFLQFFIDLDEYMEGKMVASWAKKANL